MSGRSEGRPAWYQDFFTWMVRTGRPAKRKGRPTLAMKDSTAKDYLQRICRLLANTDPPYLEAVTISRHNGTMGQEVEHWATGDRLVYKVIKDIREITIQEIMSGIRKLFPAIDDSVVPNYRHFQQGGVVLIRYLVYEVQNQHGKPILSEKALDTWRDLIPSRTVKMPKLDIIDMEILDEFILWLKDFDRDLWAPTWIMRHAGLRYSGMRNSTVNLDGNPSGPGKIKLSIIKRVVYENGEKKIVEHSHLTIWEKQTPRDFDLAQYICQFLLAQQEYIREKYPDYPWLFINRWGNQYHIQSGSYDAAIRRAYVKWATEKFGKAPDPSEVRLLRAHNLRHAMGVALFKAGMREKHIKDIMGHQDYKTLERYIQHVRDDLGDTWDKVTEGGSSGGGIKYL